MKPVLARGMSSSISTTLGRSTSSSSSSARWGEELPVDPTPSSAAACVWEPLYKDTPELRTPQYLFCPIGVQIRGFPLHTHHTHTHLHSLALHDLSLHHLKFESLYLLLLSLSVSLILVPLQLPLPPPPGKLTTPAPCNVCGVRCAVCVVCREGLLVISLVVLFIVVIFKKFTQVFPLLLLERDKTRTSSRGKHLTKVRTISSFRFSSFS